MKGSQIWHCIELIYLLRIIPIIHYGRSFIDSCRIIVDDDDDDDEISDCSCPEYHSKVLEGER